MKILITGAHGFLGRHLQKQLADYDTYAAKHSIFDLRLARSVDGLLELYEPDIIFHLAADVGGIDYNLRNPATIYNNNVLMNTHLIHKAALQSVKKFIFVSSACIYPLETSIPTKEDELFKGEIEPSNRSYGLSKLIALQQLRACKEQYGMDFAYPILANLYGPGDGGFEQPTKAHLIPNLIKQFANKATVVMRGNGSLTRDLLYVAEAAQALKKFIDIDYDEPVNIATGTEVSIREIAGVLTRVFDKSKLSVIWSDEPDKGEQRRCYDTSRAKEALDWQAKITIEEGLKETVEWYKSL